MNHGSNPVLRSLACGSRTSLASIACALALGAQGTGERALPLGAAQVPAPSTSLPLVRLDGGGPFLEDPHHGGAASSLHLLEVVWGRLVDVHDVDTSGATSARPVFEDLVVNENIQSDGVNYRLETSPAVARTRLVILRS